ncbi:MAG: hypothetical protein Q4D50_07975 [Eubacteriales bacterium]|nr:hypothetical protein [Eubacteriales bacterium]
MKMTVKKARKLRDRLLLGGFVLMLLGYLYDPIFIVGLIVAFSCLIPDFLFNKCPHCGKRLGRNNGDFCQFCGKPLDQ